CEEVAARPNGTLMLVRTGAMIDVGEVSQCVERYRGRMLGWQAGPLLDVLHYLSGGAVGFARGLNDTPKIVALLLAAEAISPSSCLALVALVIGARGVLNSRRGA